MTPVQSRRSPDGLRSRGLLSKPCDSDWIALSLSGDRPRSSSRAISIGADQCDSARRLTMATGFRRAEQPESTGILRSRPSAVRAEAAIILALAALLTIVPLVPRARAAPAGLAVVGLTLLAWHRRAPAATSLRVGRLRLGGLPRSARGADPCVAAGGSSALCRGDR